MSRNRHRRAVQQRRHARRAGAACAVLVLTSGVAAAVAAGYNGYNSFLNILPDVSALSSMEPPLDTHVFADDGKSLIATFHQQSFRHEHVNLKDISLFAQRATIDVEDRHFYEQGSWDLPRIAKAGFDDVTHSGPLQGASTITEQLAKISFLSSSERTLDRKFKQLILGNQIEARFSKDLILEMYLNRVPYGNHSVGIGTAAHMYFHKPASDLDLAEASMLAGLPESPTTFDPLIHAPTEAVNPQAKTRQRTVINAMVTVGDISAAQGDAALAEDLTFHSWVEAEASSAPHFLDYLRQYLAGTYGNAYLNPGGWEIVSTLDPSAQSAAEHALHDGVAAVRNQFNAHDGSIVSIDPRNGEVRALVGTWDYADAGVGQLNMAVRPVQPGSTIKVFTYAAAIASRKFTMVSPILDAPVQLESGSGQPYSPLNYDRKFHGVCPLKICLGNSFNIPAVKVEAATGIPAITNLEIASGLTALRDPDNQPGPKDYAATLGALKHGISPLDLASGAATLADLGVHHQSTPIRSIVDTASGAHNYTHNAAADAQRAIPENAAYIIDQITSNDANRVMEFGPHGALTLPGRRVSAKTGTTEFFVDNWTVGWTPYLATAVWVGNPQPSCVRGSDRSRLSEMMRSHLLYSGQTLEDPFSPGDLANYGLAPLNDHCGHLEGATGITGAAPIWNAYMSRALAGSPTNWYAKPADVNGRGTGDDGDFFIRGTEPPPVAGCVPAGPPTDPNSICKPPAVAPPRPQPALPPPQPGAQSPGNLVPFFPGFGL